MRRIITATALMLVHASGSHAQPVDATAAAQAFNVLSERMVTLERRLDAMAQAWDTLTRTAIIGFNGPRCPQGWVPLVRSNVLVVAGPDGTNQRMELRTGPHVQIGQRTTDQDAVPAQKILFCTRAPR